MGMICPKCGTDNLMNAIFCRGCGEKIDVAAMKPEDLLKDAKQKKKKEKKGSLASTIVSSVIFGLIVILIAAALIPAGGLKPGEVEDGPKKLLSNARKGIGETATFTDQEATSLITKNMKLPATGNADFLNQNYSIQFKNDNVIRVVMGVKAYGFLPLNYCVTTKVSCAAKGQVQFEVQSVRLGWIPMVGGLREKVLAPVRAQAGNSKALDQLKKQVKGVTTTKGSITLNL